MLYFQFLFPSNFTLVVLKSEEQAFDQDKISVFVWIDRIKVVTRSLPGERECDYLYNSNYTIQQYVRDR